MKLARNGQSGYAYILVLILLAAVSLFVVPMLRQSFTVQKYHQIIETNTLNTYAADAGIEYGLCEVYNNSADYQSTNLAYGDVINNMTVNVTAEYIAGMGLYKITSTATSNDGRSTTIETYVIIEVGLFGNAFACDGNLTIKNTDLSANATQNCDVYASGNVLLDDATVDGDVVAAGYVTLKDAFVSGEIIEGADVLEFPPIDPQPHIDAALEGGTFEGTYTKDDLPPDGSLGPLYINGNLDIKGRDIVLGGTVYTTGSFKVDVSTITGFGDIVANGEITFDHFTMNVDNPQTLPLVMSVDGSIVVRNCQSGSPGMEAIIYSPYYNITIDVCDIVGSVAGENIVVDHSMIFYPASLEGRPDLPGAGLETITYGYK